MEFFGHLVSNILTLVLFACALFLVLRHAVHCGKAVAQIATAGGSGRTPVAWLVPRLATSFGILLAMTSSFGLDWWLTMGSVPGTAPRVPHLHEFLNHFLSRYLSEVFGSYPWVWYSGWLGTPVWALRLVLLVGFAAFLLLGLRNILDPRIRDISALWVVPRNVLAGFLAMAMVTYWWPAGMGDRPFFTIVMILLCFIGLGAFGGVVEGNSRPSSPSSPSSDGWAPPQGRAKKVPDQDDFWTAQRKRDDKAGKDATKAWQEDERKARERRDKDEKKRREDAEEKQRKDKDQDDRRRREQDLKDADDLAWRLKKEADDLAWRLKEEAKKAAWEAEQRRKDEEHRRK